MPIICSSEYEYLNPFSLIPPPNIEGANQIFVINFTNEIFVTEK